MQTSYVTVGTMIALLVFQIGNTAFGQPVQTPETKDTKLCVDYKGTNLIIVRIRNPVDRELGDCQKELDRQIASFHPTGIAISSTESELNPGMGGPVTRYDVVYLIK